MSVESFDPGAVPRELTDATVAALCELAPAADVLELALQDVRRFAAVSKDERWSEKSATLSDAQIVALIRLFTLGEEQYPEWAAGAASPVIALVRELKTRGTYDADITRWIKAHSSNKFLPHGSLLDRL